MFFVRTGDRQRGPYSGPQLHQLAAAGEMQPTDYIRQHNSDQWTLAGQVPGLFPADAAAPAQASYSPAPSGSFDPYQSPAGMDGSWPQPREQLKHSGLGIASFVLSVAVGVLFLALFAFAGFLAARPGGINARSPEMMTIGFVAIGLFFTDLVALGLGIAGLVQRDRKKVFAVLGTIFSGSVVLIFGGLMVIGMMAG